MARTVLSESITVSMALEAALGVAPAAPAFLQWQPNPGGVSGWRRENITVERDPLSKYASHEKGDIVGYNANPRLVDDITFETLYQAAGPIFRCLATNPGGTNQFLYRPTVVVDGGVSADSFTVPLNGALAAGRLVRTFGFANAQNNALLVVDAGSGANNINVPTGSLVPEAAAPANAILLVVGVRAAVAADIRLDASGNLTSQGGVDFTTLDLEPGMTLILGGEDVANRFATLHQTRPMVAIVAETPTAAEIKLTQRNFTIGADPAAGKFIDLYFGPFFRNYPYGDPKHARPTMYGELEEIDAATNNTVPAYTYAEGLALKTFELNAPLEQKMVGTYSFVGMRMTDPVLTVDRKAGAAAALAPLLAALFDSQNDLEYVGFYSASAAALIGEINSWSITIEHSAEARKVQGTPGGIDHNYGKFEFVAQNDAYFNDYDQAKAFNDNRDLLWKTLVGNHQGGFALHAPNVSLRGGEKTFTANKPVMLPAEARGNRDPLTNIVAAMTLFGFVPNGGRK